MRKSYVLSASAILTACSPAAAVVPDSGNPAHCVAGFHYAAYWFKVGNRPEKVTAMVARSIFEMEKVKSSGMSEAAAKAEGRRLTEAYVKDHETMMSLIRACGSAQDGDPKYKSELPRLFALARSIQVGLGSRASLLKLSAMGRKLT